MKIGLAQLNPIVGDLDGNKEKILHAYKTLVNEDAQLVVFPELSICGYPPRDLLLKLQFVKDMEVVLEEIASAVGSVPALVGYVDRNSGEIGAGDRYYNAVAWCEEGKIKAIGHKCLLPTYGVFDEHRYFKPGNGPLFMPWKGKLIGITICEDIWTGKYNQMERRLNCDPVQIIAERAVDLVINLSASPWFYGKKHIREDLIKSVATRCNAPVVYCNQIGGNDELIFDGQSLVGTKDGNIHSHLPAFEESVQVIDLAGKGFFTDVKEDIENIHNALVLGIRDYARKSAFKQALVGLSGGIDSAVVATLAVEALGKENVMGVSLPSKISSDHSKKDAQELAKNLGIKFTTVGIEGIVAGAEKSLDSLFKGHGEKAAENIQARSRGLILMAISNEYGSLLLSTGNKSEIAVGYCTLYGDMAGGLSVLADVLKTKVYKLAEFINRKKEIIPHNTLIKPPSAELKPGQTDEASLGPYEVIDPIICAYVEDHLSVNQIIKQGFDEAIVRRITRMIDANEYKRKQMTIGLKITPLAFGVGRRMPIAHKYKER